LRITVEENSSAMTLKLEGRVAGPWAAELSRVWEQTLPTVAARPLSLDLRETTYADAAGIQALRDIYAQTGAAILTGTPWTQYLAQKVKSADTEPIGEEV
jgi:anti-anti-sigma regulatory factor